MAISFGAGRPWGAVSVLEYRRKAKDPRHPLVYRLHFAAIGRANCIGHAEFGPGELSRILSGEDGQPANASSVSRAIRSGLDLDLVAPGSRARCLVLGHHAFRKERFGGRDCKTHGINLGA